MQLDNVEDIYPLTSTQAGMLFHSMSEPDSGVYVGQFSSRLTGDFKRHLFENAWQQVIQHHTALRAIFIWDGVDEPLQLIRQHVNLDWKVLDWQTLSESEYVNAMEAYLSTERKISFDLGSAPLMRMTLIHVDNDQWYFIWTVHHLLLDGWSAHIVLNEVLQLYHSANRGSLPELPPIAPWRDYINWLQVRDSKEDEFFWRQYLTGFKSANVLQIETKISNNSTEASVFMSGAVLSSEISKQLVNTAKTLRITLSTLMHGAWAILLHHYCGQRDLVFGSTVSGRPAELNGVENMVGMFINTLPVRVKINSEETLDEWLQTLQKNLVILHEYEVTPLVKIQGWSELAAAQALFDTDIVFENYPVSNSNSSDTSLRLDEFKQWSHSHYSLALLIEVNDSIQLSLLHHLNHYSEETAQLILQHLQTILTAIPDSLDQSLLKLTILNATEKKQLDNWNKTASQLCSDLLLHQQIAEQAHITPHAMAVACGDDKISYSNLNSLANQWAHELIAHNVFVGDCVGLCINRSVNMIVAVLAILKAGAAYVPLDPDYPKKRLQSQLVDCEAKIMLCDSQSISLFSSADVQLINIQNKPSQQLETSPDIDITPDSIAYIIYTSGSTGQAKGVQVTHKNLIYSTAARQQYYPQQPKAFLLLSSLSFDSSVAGIFWSLSQGAILVVSGYRIEQDLNQLANLIARYQVSHTLCLPSLYQTLLEYADSSLLNSLNTVIVAGETFPVTGLLDMHRRLLPDTELYNEYGPTETTVWATVFNTKDHPDGKPVPIGKPIANTCVLILDNEGRQCPVGIPGEIYIGGEGVAKGYLNKIEVTDRKFVRLAYHSAPLYRSGDLGFYLSDGSIVFTGRCDNQIKIRGYRIEPDEIAIVLSNIIGVERAIVVAKPINQALLVSRLMDESEIEKLTDSMLTLGEKEADLLLQEIENLPEPPQS